MKRKFYLFEFLLLVVFVDLSVGTPPMNSGRGSSSSAAEALRSYFPRQRSYPRIIKLKLLIRGQSATRTNLYLDSSILLVPYDDPFKFEYVLRASDRDRDYHFASSGRNTDIVSLVGNKMKIRTKDNIDALYSIEFKDEFDAHFVGDFIIATQSEQYNECKGSHTFKLEQIYKYQYDNAESLVHLGPDYCILKTRLTDMITFTIRYVSPTENYKSMTCVFRSTEYWLGEPDANNKMEFRISFGGPFLDPKYILETPKPDNLRTFLSSE